MQYYVLYHPLSSSPYSLSNNPLHIYSSTSTTAKSHRHTNQILTFLHFLISLMTSSKYTLPSSP